MYNFAFEHDGEKKYVKSIPWFPLLYSWPLYRQKNIFISWSPDTAKIKASFLTKRHYLNTKLTVNQQKMMFASSRDALGRSLVGIGAEIQAIDYSEISWEAVYYKVTRSPGH
jgi:hypothetical protein